MIPTCSIRYCLISYSISFGLYSTEFSYSKANHRRFNITDPVTGQEATLSLLTYWLRLITNELNKYSTMPVLTYKEDDLYALMLERMARDACKYVNLMFCLSLNIPSCTIRQHINNGTITDITISGGKACKLGITGVNVSTEPVCVICLIERIYSQNSECNC